MQCEYFDAAFLMQFNIILIYHGKMEATNHNILHIFKNTTKIFTLHPELRLLTYQLFNMRSYGIYTRYYYTN